MSMKSVFNISKNMNKLNYEFLSLAFKNKKGNLTKFMNIKYDHKYLAAYLARAEIPIKNSNQIYVALSYVPVHDLNIPITFYKAIAMNKVVTGGQRKLNKLLKNSNKIKSESLKNYFLNNKNQDTLDFLEINELNNDKNFLDFVTKFEKKINKYYKNKNVKTIIV